MGVSSCLMLTADPVELLARHREAHFRPARKIATGDPCRLGQLHSHFRRRAHGAERAFLVEWSFGRAADCTWMGCDVVSATTNSETY